MHISILTQSRGWVHLYPIAVSILTQPGGWVQRLNSSTFCLLTFQSSPNLSVGCIWAMEVFQLLRPILCFNPHPTYRLGEATGNKQRMVLSRFNPHLTSRLGAVRSDANFNPHPISWLDASGLWKSFNCSGHG